MSIGGWKKLKRSCAKLVNFNCGSKRFIILKLNFLKLARVIREEVGKEVLCKGTNPGYNTTHLYYNINIQLKGPCEGENKPTGASVTVTFSWGGIY